MFDIIDPRTIPQAWAWAASTTWCRINSTCACPILRTHSSVVRASFVCDLCDVISLVHSLPPVCADKNSNVEMSSTQAPRDKSWRLLACSFAHDVKLKLCCRSKRPIFSARCNTLAVTKLLTLKGRTVCVLLCARVTLTTSWPDVHKELYTSRHGLLAPSYTSLSPR